MAIIPCDASVDAVSGANQLVSLTLRDRVFFLAPWITWGFFLRPRFRVDVVQTTSAPSLASFLLLTSMPSLSLPSFSISKSGNSRASRIRDEIHFFKTKNRLLLFCWNQGQHSIVRKLRQIPEQKHKYWSRRKKYQFFHVQPRTERNFCVTKRFNAKF